MNMDQDVIRHGSQKETKLPFRWLFLSGTVLAAILPFLPYIEDYSPLRASGEVWVGWHKLRFADSYQK